MAALYPSAERRHEATCRNLVAAREIRRSVIRMYAAEVPAYTTLVEVSAGVNREYASAHRAPIGWARWSG